MTEKKISDYLHLYLGCDVQTPDGVGKLHSVSVEANGKRSNRIKVFFGRMVKTENSIDGYDKHRNHGSYLIEQESYVGINAPEGTPPEFTMPGGCKPILRPLSDMTNEDWITYYRILDGQNDKPGIECKAEAMLFLLSKHFDLFSLIESGIAIDKTKT